MPEDDFETAEFKEKLDDATERAVEASEHRARWIVHLSFSTALIAVFAAIAALESGTFSNQALIEKNEALLAQAKASDQWAYYQAKSVKGAIYASQAAAMESSNADLAARARKEAERYSKEEEEISKSAKELEKEVAEKTELSANSMEHHHRVSDQYRPCRYCRLEPAKRRLVYGAHRRCSWSRLFCGWLPPLLLKTDQG